MTRLRESAASTSELAQELGIPKGTIAHHLKVLENAGLVRVVRTRKVRAVTEKYYGRTARLFVFQNVDAAMAEALGAASLRSVADEIGPTSFEPERGTFATIRSRLGPADARRFLKRVERLTADFLDAEDPDGEPYRLAVALYPREETRRTR